MTGQHPRLGHHSRTRKSGKVVTYYFYDMRPEGKPDVPLGTDFEDALKKWDALHNRAPRIVGTLEAAFDDWETEMLPTYTNAHTRNGYRKQLLRLRPVFQIHTWEDIDLPVIKGYLKRRSAKTQGNREMALLSVIWNWARGEGLTTLPWPAAGMEKSKWKNKEKPRRMKVTTDLFEVVYAEADQVLRDCMDVGSATGMRLTDCISVLLPRNDVLHLEANKTGKEADFDLSLSAVLPELIRRRRAIDADHLMLLSTPDGHPVNLSMLRYRWDIARHLAACKIYAEAGLLVDYSDDQAEAYALAREVRRMYLRDMRKRASQLSGSLAEASALLQHPNEAFTQKHYGSVARLKPAR